MSTIYLSAVYINFPKQQQKDPPLGIKKYEYCNMIAVIFIRVPDPCLLTQWCLLIELMIITLKKDIIPPSKQPKQRIVYFFKLFLML